MHAQQAAVAREPQQWRAAATASRRLTASMGMSTKVLLSLKMPDSCTASSSGPEQYTEQAAST